MTYGSAKVLCPVEPCKFLSETRYCLSDLIMGGLTPIAAETHLDERAIFNYFGKVVGQRHVQIQSFG